jgi:hypothetical protein
VISVSLGSVTQYSFSMVGAGTTSWTVSPPFSRGAFDVAVGEGAVVVEDGVCVGVAAVGVGSSPLDRPYSSSTAAITTARPSTRGTVGSRGAAALCCTVHPWGSRFSIQSDSMR